MVGGDVTDNLKKGESENDNMTNRRRVTFYVKDPRKKRRKKVSFLAKW